MSRFVPLFVLAVCLGCANEQPTPQKAQEPKPVPLTKAIPTKLPVFTLEYSEYPSWSALDVASVVGIVNGEEGGKFSDLELKHGVDVVIQRRDYIQSMKEFSAGKTDAVCVTNIDSLNLVKGRPSTAILPTSTSDGADGVLAVGIKDVGDLRGKEVRGAEDSVSEYMFHRGMELSKENPNKTKFVHMEPDAASLALQTGSGQVKAIAVWQPFLLQTVRNRPECKLLFDSKLMKLEIIDCVLVGNDSLKREGGENFAKAVTDIYYTLNKRLANPQTADNTTVLIGKKFCSLELKDMQEVLTTCKFFKTPEAAEQLLSDTHWQKLMLNTVVDTSVKVGIVKKKDVPSIGFNDPSKELNFSTKYLKP